MKKLNQKYALAFHFGCATADIEWYQPRAGEKVRVFASGDSYYCATSGAKQPPKNYQWKALPDGILNAQGWRIWEAKVVA